MRFSWRQVAALRTALLLLLIALLAGFDPAQAGFDDRAASPAAQAEAGLFQPTAQRGPAGTSFPASVLRSRFVTVDFAPFAAPTTAVAARLTLNLFPDVVLTAERESAQTTRDGRVIWIGRVPGEQDSRVSLVAGGGVLVGNITLPRGMYQIRLAGQDAHVIYEIDPAFTPPPEIESSAFDVPPDPAAPPVLPLAPSTVPVGIDVMVVWSPAARTAAGGTTAMQNLVNLAVAETNTAYNNSLINQQLTLVHATEVTYTEAGFSTDLTRLTNQSDGFIDQVHTLRNQYGADEVALIINDASSCGLAWLMTTPAASFESNAFSVTHWDCATGYYSFGHELAHNMGSTHDRPNAGGSGSYSYSYGYQDLSPTDSFRTVMGYAAGCPGACPRIQYFSNPDVNYHGRPTGIDESAPNSANNALSLNNTAPIVAAWRSSVGPSPTSTPTRTPTATNTPTPTVTPWIRLVGHVTWQGRPAQPNALNQLPITLTLQLSGNETHYPNLTTDTSGFFTVSVQTLPNGMYNWWVKGPRYLAANGTVNLTGALQTQQEMGQQRAGDVDNSNLVDITDFTLLRATFGKGLGDVGYDGRADFTGDNLVDITDFTLQRSNFGQAGPPQPTGPSGGTKP